MSSSLPQPIAPPAKRDLKTARPRSISIKGEARRAIQAQMAALLRNEEGARSGDNPEALHDMRVASRRMREAFRVFGSIFPRKRLKQVTAEMRRITRSLGTVREVDVNLEQLSAWRKKLGGHHSLPLEFVTATELARQRRLKKRMRNRLETIDLQELQNEVQKLLRHIEEEESRDAVGNAQPVSSSLVSLAGPQTEQGLKSVGLVRDRLALHSTLHNFHLLRIQTKKFRYSVEILSRAFLPGRSGRILKQLKKLQDELGALHDGAVLHQRIRELRAEFRSAQLAHLDEGCLRLMRIIAREQRRRKTIIEAHLRRLDRHRFFEQLPDALKRDETSTPISS